MHGSLLPAFRGRAPVNWAILKGATVTGATLHDMTEKPDAGDIVDQEQVPIGPDDDGARGAAARHRGGRRRSSRGAGEAEGGNGPARPARPDEAAHYFGGRRPEDGRIDWIRPAQEVHDLVRAVTHPWPGRLHGRLRRRDVRLEDAALRATAGTTLSPARSS